MPDLVEVSKRLPTLHLHLANASVTARHIGEAVSCLTDSITGRLLEMAEAELGKPPVPYVWMAGGSQARHEQSSHSDQDNALLLSDEFKPEHDEYFAALAKFVSDGLNDCGFVYCPGNAMATNPEWRQPLKVWKEYFTRWIESPTPMSMMLSSIFFDLRPVTGSDELFKPLQKMILKKSQVNRIFLAHMMANAMKHRPPLGFFRQFVLERGGEHDETLDLKHRGIVPITDIARVLALSLGEEAGQHRRAPARLCRHHCAVGRHGGKPRGCAGIHRLTAYPAPGRPDQERNRPPDNYVPPGPTCPNSSANTSSMHSRSSRPCRNPWSSVSAPTSWVEARVRTDSSERSINARRRWPRRRPGPLADYLATPFPHKHSNCRDLEIVAIDLETTGLDPTKDEILSIGLVNIDDWAIKLSTSWHSIVRIDKAIPGETAVIHHITDDQSAAGAPLEELLPEVLKRLAGRAMLVHYSPIEQNFLSAACQKLYGAPFVAPIIDTLEIAPAHLPAPQPHHTARATCACSISGPGTICPSTRRTMRSATPWRPPRCFWRWPTTCTREQPCPLREFSQHRPAKSRRAPMAEKKPNLHKTLLILILVFIPPYWLIFTDEGMRMSDTALLVAAGRGRDQVQRARTRQRASHARTSRRYSVRTSGFAAKRTRPSATTSAPPRSAPSTAIPRAC